MWSGRIFARIAGWRGCPVRLAVMLVWSVGCRWWSEAVPLMLLDGVPRR